MTKFTSLTCLKPQPSDNDNRISFTWIGPDNIERTYAINQRTLSRFSTPEEIKSALDDWTFKSFGYIISDIWFHKNRDGTWALAVGEEPARWPEDIIPPWGAT